LLADKAPLAEVVPLPESEDNAVGRRNQIFRLSIASGSMENSR
jgi:hypothetical protein